MLVSANKTTHHCQLWSMHSNQSITIQSVYLLSFRGSGCFSCHAEAQDAYSDGSSPHKSIVSDDAEEVFGESIDEDSQSVKPPDDTAPPPSTSGAWPHTIRLKDFSSP